MSVAAAAKMKRVVLDALKSGPLTKQEVMDRARKGGAFLHVKNKVLLNKIDSAVNALIREGKVVNGQDKSVLKDSGGLSTTPCYRLAPQQGELNLKVRKKAAYAPKHEIEQKMTAALTDVPTSCTDIAIRAGVDPVAKITSIRRTMHKLADEGVAVKTTAIDHPWRFLYRRADAKPPFSTAPQQPLALDLEASRKPAPQSMVIDGMEFISIREHNRRLLEQVTRETEKLILEKRFLEEQVDAIVSSQVGRETCAGVNAKIRRISTVETLSGRFIHIDFGDIDGHDLKPGELVTIIRREK